MHRTLDNRKHLKCPWATKVTVKKSVEIPSKRTAAPADYAISRGNQATTSLDCNAHDAYIES
jgi:hypothetical protein